MTKPVIGFHKVLLVRGLSLRVEQDWTCKFAEMTLKRSGNFIDFGRTVFAVRPRVGCIYFLFLIKTGGAALIKVVQAKIQKLPMEIG